MECRLKKTVNPCYPQKWNFCHNGAGIDSSAWRVEMRKVVKIGISFTSADMKLLLLISLKRKDATRQRWKTSNTGDAWMEWSHHHGISSLARLETPLADP